jgi:ABC-type multidrug transport system ATPase subunit
LQLRVDGRTVTIHPDHFFIIGRSGHPDLRLRDSIVSRRHLVIGFKDCWFIEDLGSRNGVFLGDRRIERERITEPTSVRLGDPHTGPLLHLAPSAANVFPAPETPGSLGTLGAPGAPGAPTFASGQQVLQAPFPTTARTPTREEFGEALAALPAPPLLSVEPAPSLKHASALQSAHTLEPWTASRSDQPRSFAGAGLKVRDLEYRVKSGKQLLRDISIDAPRGTLTAIVGPSGAGKSTFAKALSGLTQPSAGQVTFDTIDVHTNYEKAKRLIGLVPQEDVIHNQLKLRRALTFAARLRLGRGRSATDRDSQVSRALSQLDLEAHVNTRISKLSGGQRKRASVALELLTEPAMLVLDEPTSGLDPALDRQLMTEFRSLADGGRSVLVITHSVACLDMCDQVLVLVPGGAPAFIGSEAAAFTHFGVADWSSIFEMLRNDPEGCAERWHASELTQHLHTQDVVRDRDQSQDQQHEPQQTQRHAPQQPAPTLNEAPAGRFVQFATLVRRQFALMLADRGYTVFLLALPFAVGLLPLVVPGDTGLTQVQRAKYMQEPQMILTLLTIGAIFMGISMSIRDLVGERSIFERERAVGLSPSAYLLAKVFTYNLIGVIGAIIIVWIATTIKRPPEGDGLLSLGAQTELTVSIAMTISSGILIGLMLSALISSQNQVMPVLVVVLMVQMVLNGGLIPLVDNGLLNGISQLVAARWSLAAGAASLDLPHLLTIADEAERLAAESSKPETDPMWKSEAARWWFSFSVLTLMAAVLLTAAWVKIRGGSLRRCRQSLV